MRKMNTFILAFMLITGTIHSANKNDINLLKYVRPMVGTSKPGQTVPAVGVPFGMTQWIPQTMNTEKHGFAPYLYTEKKITGFRASHWISGSAMKDYGSVSVMPVTGSLKTKTENYVAILDHKKEFAAPDYYRIELNDIGVTAELTGLARSGMFRFTAIKTDSLFLLIMPNNDKGKAFIRINAAKNEISGFNPVIRGYAGAGKPAGFSGYFVIQCDKQFIKRGVFSDDEVLTADSLGNKKNLGAFIGFKMKKGEQVKLRIGTSFTSIDEARVNLESEIKHWNFEKIRSLVANEWEKELSKIQVKTSDTIQKRIFYTSMYHAMQQPRLANDVNGSYPRFSQQYQTGIYKDGDYYDDFSMWDIYRAHLPLFEIINPDLTNAWIRSMIVKGQDGGWLPIFPCWNSYTSEMIGDHVAAYIASAYMKGIRNYDVNEAYRLVRQNAFEIPADEAEYVDGKGRRGVKSYIKYGYIPLDDPVSEAPNPHKNAQVSRTLEYAFDDYAVAQMAKELGKSDDYKILLERSLNYKNVFDTTLHTVRGRYADGSWLAPFNPDNIKYSFITEGTPRQYMFYVPQDVPGLANLMGGRSNLEMALDSLFLKNKYWHGNEPGHQSAFLYNYTASPWKTQQQVRSVIEKDYHDSPAGLSGNDDAGQMSAWYIFASMGFYPVNPVSGEYQLCSPLFDEVTIKINKNNVFHVITHKNAENAIYIEKILMNGSPYTKNYINFSDIKKGIQLEFYLVDYPTEWGSKNENQAVQQMISK